MAKVEEWNFQEIVLMKIWFSGFVGIGVGKKKKKIFIFLPKYFFIHSNKAIFGGEKSGKYKNICIFLAQYLVMSNFFRNFAPKFGMGRSHGMRSGPLVF